MFLRALNRKYAMCDNMPQIEHNISPPLFYLDEESEKNESLLLFTWLCFLDAAKYEPLNSSCDPSCSLFNPCKSEKIVKGDV